MKKAWNWIKKIIIRVIHIDEKPIVIHHDQPIPVDPPVRPKEEEK